MYLWFSPWVYLSKRGIFFDPYINYMFINNEYLNLNWIIDSKIFVGSK